MWIKLTPSDGVQAEQVLASEIIQVRRVGAQIQVRIRGDDSWRVAHDVGESLEAFSLLVGALGLNDSI